MMVTTLTTAVGIRGEAGDGDVITLIDNEHIANVEPLKAPSA